MRVSVVVGGWRAECTGPPPGRDTRVWGKKEQNPVSLCFGSKAKSLLKASMSALETVLPALMVD